MLRRCAVRCVRRKHGQKTWSPNGTSSGAAPATGVTAQEALQIAYRPMPPAQTVEYEEDFGGNLMIHREFISKKHRQQMSFNISPLSYSDVELRRGQQRFADAMNRERRGVLLGGSASGNDRVDFHADGGDMESSSGSEVESARYLFNEQRMQYCDRFQEAVGSRLHELRREDGRAGQAVVADTDAEDGQVLFSLMEACAIVSGCDTIHGREAYFRAFGGLDLDTLEDGSRELAERQADAASVKDALNKLSSSASGCAGGSPSLAASPDSQGRDSGAQRGSVDDIIKSMPNLFDDDGDDGDAGAAGLANSSASGHLSVQASPQPAAVTAGRQTSNDAVPEAYAPIVRAYLAHTNGESPVPSHDVHSLVATAQLHERRQWRNIMDKCVSENYSAITRQELKAAAKLDEQLHTVKFFKLKVGDTVKSIMSHLRRETGDASSVDRADPLEVSATHPERRV